MSFIRKLFGSSEAGPTLLIKRSGASVRLPGNWQESAPSSEFVVYEASGQGRQCILSMHPLRGGLSTEQRQEGFVRLYEIRVKAEGQLGGGGTIIDHTSSFDEPLWSVRYIRVHPNADRHALCHIIADSSAMAVLYYEALSMSLSSFRQEAEKISRSFILGKPN